MQHTTQSSFRGVPEIELPKVVIRLSALGDVALITGPLLYWNQRYGWRFIVLTKAANAPLFAGHPAVLRVLSLQDNELHFPTMLRKFQELAQTFAGHELLDLHGNLRTRLLGALWQGPVRRYNKLGLERRLYLQSHGRLFTEKLLESNVPQRYLSATEQHLPDRTALGPRLFLSQEELNEAEGLLAPLLSRKASPVCAESGWTASLPNQVRPVAIHPYATHPDKAWTDTNWLRLITMLEKSHLPWIVIGRGTPLPDLPEGHDFTNKTTLRQTCALLRHCRVLVTGDSGPMHLAAGVGTPVVALFGPTCEAWGFFPSGQHDQVLQVPLDCRPCTLHGNKHCSRNHDCMDKLAPEQVMEAIQNAPH